MAATNKSILISRRAACTFFLCTPLICTYSLNYCNQLNVGRAKHNARRKNRHYYSCSELHAAVSSESTAAAGDDDGPDVAGPNDLNEHDLFKGKIPILFEIEDPASSSPSNTDYQRQQQRWNDDSMSSDHQQTLSEFEAALRKYPPPRNTNEMFDNNGNDNFARMSDGYVPDGLRGNLPPTPPNSIDLRDYLDEFDYMGKTSDEIYEMVFSQESGFGGQSSDFRGSFLGDDDETFRAIETRRNEAERETKDQYTRMLEEEVSDLNEALNKRREEEANALIDDDDDDLTADGANMNDDKMRMCRSCSKVIYMSEWSKGQGVCQFCDADARLIKENVSVSVYQEKDMAMRNKYNRAFDNRQSRSRYGPSRPSYPPYNNRRPGSFQGQQPNSMRGPQIPSPEQANESRLTRQMEDLRSEVKMQRTRAEDAEREMERLKAMVSGLESALTDAIGKSKASKYVNAECINNDGDVVANEWVVVEDPDSDEIFYMNEETGEMKWELN